MARLRIGPLSYGPGGRRGIHAGPFSFSYNTRNRAFGAFMLVVVIGAIIRAIWLYLLVIGVLTLLVIAVVWPLTRGKRAERAAAIQQRRTAERAEAEAQAQEMARARAQAEAEWLNGPPPTLVVPRRFSEDWFAANIPKLHPGQVPALLNELRARGWTDDRIAQRITRYLVINPYLHRAPPT